MRELSSLIKVSDSNELRRSRGRGSQVKVGKLWEAYSQAILNS